MKNLKKFSALELNKTTQANTMGGLKQATQKYRWRCGGLGSTVYTGTLAQMQDAKNKCTGEFTWDTLFF